MWPIAPKEHSRRRVFNDSEVGDDDDDDDDDAGNNNYCRRRYCRLHRTWYSLRRYCRCCCSCYGRCQYR